MKVVFLSRSLTRGGAERQLAMLAAGLQGRGHDVAVLTFYPDNPFAPEICRAGARVFSVEKTGRWNVVGFVRRLIRMIRHERPDVIHTYLPVPNLVGAILKPLLPPMRLVWGIRSSNVDLSAFDWLTRATYRVEPFFAFAADLLIVNSEAGRRFCIDHGYPAARMTFIPNGVSIEEFRPRPDERERVRAEWDVGSEPLIGLVGRIDPLKDHATFLRAARRVLDRRPDARFACVGGGDADLLSELQNFATKIGLSQRLLWTGSRTDMCAVYNACDIVCSSSITEGFPNSVLESMACGTPCVVTDAGDSKLIVENTGAVVPIADDEAMAAALLSVLEGAESLGDAARARAIAEFSAEALIDRTAAALEELVS
ncbi:MAG TPA: glycosyltransferase [Vicinamibacterales bacterium]|nr:glycosyltransferase [Vicinamibacterales bacterium]